MAKLKKGTPDSPRVAVDPETLIARAPGWRWQRGCEAEEVALDSKSKRRMQRVHDAVKALAKSGRINGMHTTAADRWVRDYEWSVRSSYVDPVTASIHGGGGNAGPEMKLAADVNASTRYREAAKAVGLVGEAILRAALGDGCSLRGLARLRGLSEVGRSNQRVGDELVAVLEALDHADRHGCMGILDPRRRPARKPPSIDALAA